MDRTDTKRECRQGVQSRSFVLGAMRTLLDAGRVPSVRAICEITGLRSTSTVLGHLRRLEAQGYVVRVRDGLGRRTARYVVAGDACPTCARPFEPVSA